MKLKTTEAQAELLNHLEKWVNQSSSNLQAVKKAYNDAQKGNNVNTAKKDNNDNYNTGPVSL